MEDTSLMTGTDASAEHIWKNICSPTRFVLLFERERQSVGSFGMLSCVLFGVSSWNCSLCCFFQFDRKLSLGPGFVVPSNLDYQVTRDSWTHFPFHCQMSLELNACS